MNTVGTCIVSDWINNLDKTKYVVSQSLMDNTLGCKNIKTLGLLVLRKVHDGEGGGKDGKYKLKLQI